MDNRFGMRKPLDPSKATGTMETGGDQGYGGNRFAGTGPRTYDPNAAPPTGLTMPQSSPWDNQSPAMTRSPGATMPFQSRPWGGQSMAPGAWPGGEAPSFTQLFRQRHGFQRAYPSGGQGIDHQNFLRGLFDRKNRGGW